MSQVRPPAVAGMFYPGDAATLHHDVLHYLEAVSDQGPAPKALVAPHAGYVYSGPIAASGYARLREARGRITRVVLLGPSHRVGFPGLATSGATRFATPLGEIPLDREGLAAIEALPQVHRLEQAHAQEHSLEVHLPFLQEVLGPFTLLPLVVGDATPGEVAQVLEQLWGGPETLIVVSSDLSHYENYATAQRMDRATSEAIEALDPAGIASDGACGRHPVKGLLVVAKRKGMRCQTIDLRNSGDTAGPKDRVVGYGTYVFH